MRSPARGTYLVAALGVTTIVSYGATQYLFGLLVVPLANEFGWSRAALSGAYGLSALVAGLVGLPIGHVVDRFGGRMLMTTGSLVCAVGLLALTRIDQPWEFTAIWGGLVGLGMALTWYPVSNAVLARWFGRQASAAMSSLALYGAFSSPLFIPLLAYVIAADGWRAALVLCAVLQIAVCAPLHFIVVRRHAAPAGFAIEEENPSLARALRSLWFWLSTGAVVTIVAANSAILVHQVAYLIGRGYPPQTAAWVAGSMGLAYLPARVVVNALVGRVRARVLLAAFMLLEGVALVVLLNERSLVWLVVYVALYGAGYGAFAPLRAIVMVELAGARAYGAITGAQGVAMAFSAALGPVAVGRAFDVYGNYALGLTACAGACACAAFFVLALDRRVRGSG